MTQEPKPGRRIVSKGEYALIGRQEAVKFGLACCFGGIAVAGLFVGMIVGIRFGMDAAFGHSSKAQGDTLAICMVVGLFCASVSSLCFHALQGGIIEASHIEVESLFTRANAADLPAPDSLVRASQEPTQAQEGVLLRAASGETPPGQEAQLLRASVGETE